MTKEELEKEARTECFMLTVNTIGIDQRDVELAYVMGAEPREKQIQIDAEHIRALQTQNGELTDKVNGLEEKLANADYQLEGRDNEIRELEAQIEKMKNCRNCKNEKIEGACGHFTQVGWCRDWKLAD